MMIVLLLFTSTIAIFSFFIRKDIMNPIFIFNFIWSLIILLFELQLFRTIEITNTTIGILYCMILSFDFGALLYSCIKKSNRKIKSDIVRKFQLRKSVFMVLAIVTIVTLLLDEIEIIKNLLSGLTFKQIMALANGKGTVEIVGSFRVLLYVFIVHPMSYVVSPVCAVQFIKYKNKKYLLINLIITFLNVAHHGGRISIFVLALSYLTVFLFYNKKEKREIKIKPKYKIIILCSIATFLYLLVLLSSSRGINDVWLSFYAYLICCIPLSTIYISSYLFAYVGSTYGALTFNGFLYPFFGLLQYFGFKAPNSYKNAAIVKNIIEDNYVRIGDYHATAANNFISAGAYPYIDGGYIFEIIVFIIIGFLIAYLYNKCCEKGSDRDLAIYCFCVIGVVFSFMSMMLSSYSYAIGLLIVAFILYENKTKETNRS